MVKHLGFLSSVKNTKLLNGCSEVENSTLVMQSFKLRLSKGRELVERNLERWKCMYSMWSSPKVWILTRRVLGQESLESGKLDMEKKHTT